MNLCIGGSGGVFFFWVAPFRCWSNMRRVRCRWVPPWPAGISRPMHFNTAGPCRLGDHYMLPASARIPQVRELVEGKHNFVVHSPRQSGKTTSFLELGRELTAEGRYCAALLSLEVGAWATDDPGKAELPILDDWRRAIQARLPPELHPPPWPEAPPGSRIAAALSAWAQACPRPLVLFLDEVDALRDATNRGPRRTALCMARDKGKGATVGRPRQRPPATRRHRHLRP